MTSGQNGRVSAAGLPPGLAEPTADWPSIPAADRFERVVEALPFALVLMRQNGCIELINRQAERMFGYSRNELCGRPLEILLPERFRSRHAGLRQAFLDSLSARAMGEGLDLYGRRKDDSEFPVEIGLSPIDLDGQVMVLAGITDITARRRAEEENVQHRRELERSNTDLEEFAYIASHDLKAPLRAITHLVQWIEEDIGDGLDPGTMDKIRMLNGRVARMQMLLDGLLAYARVDATHSTYEMIDTEALVRDVVEGIGPPPGFTVACQGRMPVIRTQRAPLERVLENLIANAIKHHDRPEGWVTISGRLVGGVAEFRVGDDGPGIDPRFHDRIFVMFQTLVRRDERESSGVGLAIVKKKVEGRGGHIRVESTPPHRGTTFVFTWPGGLS